jgi:hypothetical protein
MASTAAQNNPVPIPITAIEVFVFIMDIPPFHLESAEKNKGVRSI